MGQNQEPRDILEFAAALSIELYEWQAKICVTIEQAANLTRKKLAVRAPNGVGKTQRIIAVSALRWLQRFPRGRVVVTSYDARQVSDQLWPALRAQSAKFPFWKWSDAEHTINSREGGRIRAFTTDDPGRAEGFHSDADCPLLIVVDEAKSVDPEIIKAIDRCSYNVLLYISSPGLKQGPFYDAFTANRESFITFAVGLTDCPHVSKEKIQDIISTYGENDPYTRSTLYGEFMDHGDGINHVFELSEIDQNRQAAISRIPGIIAAGVDFAAGGAQNTIIKRNGNFVEAIKEWRDKDTYAATGRFAHYFLELSLRPGQIFADADGLGLPMCDQLAAVGWRVNRLHGGAKAPHPRYRNLRAYLWHETAAKVKRHQIIVPDHPLLIQQLTAPRIKYAADGRLWIEDKAEMASRGIDSPDLADAFCYAFGVQPARSVSWVRDETNFAEIAHKHGWEYTKMDEDPGRSSGPNWPGDYPGEEGSSFPSEGFGGVWSI